MKANIFFIWLLLLLLFAPIAKGQDPSFSQFYFNQLYFNPAFCGSSRGFSTSLTHRVLWPNIPGKFNTSKFSADLDMSNYPGFAGIGIILVTDVEGAGFLKTNTFGIPLSTRINISNQSIIQFGLLTSIQYRSVNWDQFVFSDQFDPVNGIVSQSSFSAPEHSSLVFPDFAAGVIYEYRNAPYKRARKKKSSLRIGFAAHHIMQPEYSFLGVNSKLPIKYVAHVSGELPLIGTSEMIMAPAFVFEKQNGLKTFYFGSNTLWRNFFIGNWCRLGEKNTDALVFVTGLKFGESAKSYISYSHDFTLSRLISGTGGSHEINLSYMIDEEMLYAMGLRKKKRPQVFMIPCPDF